MQIVLIDLVLPSEEEKLVLEALFLNVRRVFIGALELLAGFIHFTAHFFQHRNLLSIFPHDFPHTADQLLVQVAV